MSGSIFSLATWCCRTTWYKPGSISPAPNSFRLKSSASRATASAGSASISARAGLANRLITSAHPGYSPSSFGLIVPAAIALPKSSRALAYSARIDCKRSILLGSSSAEASLRHMANNTVLERNDGMDGERRFDMEHTPDPSAAKFPKKYVHCRLRQVVLTVNPAATQPISRSRQISHRGTEAQREGVDFWLCVSVPLCEPPFEPASWTHRVTRLVHSAACLKKYLA